MIERDPQKELIVAKSITVNSIDEMRANGLSDSEIDTLCVQVSRAIDEYNVDHPAEMLSKSPEVIWSQLELGLSALIYTQTSDGLLFLYHGTSYEMFEQGEELVLGTQILEFGSAITNPNFRAGYGLGTRGALARAQIMNKYFENGLEAFGLSTIKRFITGHVWSKAIGAQAVSFWEIPYIAYLTDTCEGSSERYGHSSCQYRRPVNDSDNRALLSAVNSQSNGGYMPCTLIVTDKDAAYQFDQHARNLHQNSFSLSIAPGDISVESYAAIGQFFESLKR